MDEDLAQDFLDEQVEDITVAILTGGIKNILYEYEFWLHKKGYLKYKDALGNLLEE